MVRRWFVFIVTVLLVGCGSGGDFEEVSRSAAVSFPQSSWFGLSAFANDPRFGSIPSQFLEVQQKLRVDKVRILLDWNDQVQPDPSLPPYFHFYDQIIDGLPPGMEALVILTDVPSWMHDSANWDNGDPRATFVNRWASVVMERYATVKAITAWEIWNEPDDGHRSDNHALDLDGSPSNYVSLLSLAHAASRRITPEKLVVMGATTSIVDDYPSKLTYNQAARDAGAESFVDVWGVHFYGRDLDTFASANGPAEFLNSLHVPIWVTETGAKGYDQQLGYAQQVWPFLRDSVPGIARIYGFQFTEDSSPGTTYGLRNLDGSSPYSDLYLYLAQRS